MTSIDIIFSYLSLKDAVKYCGNNSNLWKYFENKENKDNLLKFASLYGHFQLVIRATNYNQAMVSACKNGHIYIIKLMIEKGATNYNDALLNTSINGHTRIVKLMMETITSKYDNSEMLLGIMNTIGNTMF